MINRRKLAGLVAVAIGALLGWMTATCKPSALLSADVKEPAAPVKTADAGRVDQPMPAASAAAAPGCCSGGVSKGRLLALADAKVAPQDEKGGEKPKVRAESDGDAAPDMLDRTVLPVPEPEPAPITELDARKAKAPPRFQVKAPKGAPNVVVILLDNVGFGDLSTFGGPIQMPTLDRLAKTGLRYNNFKVPPLCSPSRMALLTGRNSHTCNFGMIAEMATAFPGYTGMRPSSVAMLPEILRLNGYSTAMFGKCHELGPWETSVVGPFDRWPVHSGFERFYGFLSGEADLFRPVMYDNLTRVDLPPDPNYYASTDLTDKAITWVHSQHSLAPDKPFFVYYSAIGNHAPFQVPEKWRDKYKGKFDQGWDEVRKETLARQIKLGVVPPDTKLAPKPEGIQDWDKLTADEKKVFARYMEIYAAFGEVTDYEIGRFLDAIDGMGEMDNTLVFYITGDNGSVFQGGPTGAFNEMSVFNARARAPGDPAEALR